MTTQTPDLAAVKAKQQATWASADFSAVATALVHPAERLAEAVDVRPHWRVLDVATGSGNAAIAAARIGCETVGADYVPSLLERGRERAAAERVPATFVEADSENLPFGNAEFDAVLSIYGAMFAPDHLRTAAEIARVCRPGGRIALASWTPEGFLGDMFRTIGGRVAPPAGVASPMQWGTEAHLEEIFGDTVTWTAHTRRIHSFRFASAEAFVDFFIANYGPTHKAIEALGDQGHVLRDELIALARHADRLGGDALAIDGEYLESVGERTESAAR